MALPMGDNGRTDIASRAQGASGAPARGIGGGVVPMEAPTLFDALVVAPAAILGVAGLWLGFWRAAVAWPMRWLIPAFGAGAAGLLGALYMVVNRDLAALFSLSGAVGVAIASAIAFGVALALLVMFMRNLRERVPAWTSRRATGLVERLLGGVLGIACGLALVAVLYVAHDALRPAREGDAPWAEGSATLPYLRGASASVRGMVRTPAPLATPRR